MVIDGSVPATCKVRTPAPLALAMVRHLGDAPKLRWLEPSVGEGVFIAALKSIHVPQERILAIDIERPARAQDRDARTIRGCDFLEWALKTGERFDRIVGNPPYLRIRTLSNVLQEAALAYAGRFGIPVDKRANYWLPFLLGALGVLATGGSLAYVLPAAWDYANYARPMRERIGSLFARVDIHRSKNPLFTGKQEGSVILICKGFERGPSKPVRFEHTSRAELVKALGIRRTNASMKQPTARRQSKAVRPQNRSIVQASTAFRIRLGGVTGDSRYFLLTEEQRHERGLPRECLLPVLSRAHHVRSATVGERDWGKLRDDSERVWMFHPTPKMTRTGAIKKYVQLPPDLGGCRRDRHKIRNREPWYVTPLPKPADGFMSGMTQDAPWICLNQYEGLNATNTLYVISFHERLSSEAQAAWCLSLLSSYTRWAARKAARRYADGLVKLEPGDIARMPLIVPRTTERAMDIYPQAVSALLTGNSKEAERLADSWLGLDG